MGNRKWEPGGGCHSERLWRIFSAGRTYAKESGVGSSGGSARSRLRWVLSRKLRPRDSLRHGSGQASLPLVTLSQRLREADASVASVN